MNKIQSSNFNIFKQLSVANKELVHSSMIKFMLEENISNIQQYLDIPDFANNYCHLEVSAGKRLRFDIVISSKEEKDEALTNPLIIIENKFKAIPTVKQLCLYDEFLKKSEISCEKRLMVFCEEQVTTSLRQYCDANKWKIKSYISFTSNDCLLNNLKKSNHLFDKDDVSKNLLLDHYTDYLHTYQNKVLDVINTEYLSKESERQYYSIYMLILLGEISKEIEEILIEEQIKNRPFIPIISESIDIGSRIIPTVALWFSFSENKKYLGINSQCLAINGTRISIGINYNKSPKYLESNMEFVRSISETIDSKYQLDSNPKLKTDEKIDNSSSMKTIFSEDLINWKNRDISKKLAKLFVDYYKSSQKIILS